METLQSFERRANELIFKSLQRKPQKLKIENLNFVNYFKVMENNTKIKKTEKKLIRLAAIKLESSRESSSFNGAKCYND